MKNILSSLTSDEKNRILEMHKSAITKEFLGEQGTPVVATDETPTITITPLSTDFQSDFNIEGFIKPDPSKYKNYLEYNQAFETSYYNYLSNYKTSLNKVILVFNKNAPKMGYTVKNLVKSFPLIGFYSGYDCNNSWEGKPGNVNDLPCKENPTLYFFNQTITTDYSGNPKKLTTGRNEADLGMRPTTSSPTVGQGTVRYSPNVSENLLFDENQSLSKVIIAPLSGDLKIKGAYGSNVILPNAIYSIFRQAPIGTLIGSIKRI